MARAETRHRIPFDILDEVDSLHDHEIVKVLSFAVWVLDEKRQRTLAVNRAFLELTGIGADDYGSLRDRPIDFIDDESRSSFLHLGEPSTTAASIRIRIGGQAREATARASYGRDANGVARWLYFLEPAGDPDANGAVRQRRLTNEAVKNSLQVYYLADRIRMAPKLAIELFGAANVDEVCRSAANFLCADGFNCHAASIIRQRGDSFELMHSTENDPNGHHFKRKLERYRRFVDDGTQPRGPVRLVALPGREHDLGILELRFHPRELELLSESEQVHAWHQDLIQMVAEIVALFMANVALHNELHQMTTVDALTGCFNRRYLLERLDAELRRAARFERDLSVAFMDLDGFKLINDGEGHAMGDFVLHELGSILKSSIRESDFVCRYGGDEFVVVFPETTIEDACAKAEFLRESVANHTFGRSVPTDPGLPGRLSLSTGVASTIDSFDARVLLRRADLALYEAKRRGKNQVVRTCDLR